MTDPLYEPALREIVTPAYLRILHRLWLAGGSATAPQIYSALQQEGHTQAYTTLNAQLGRLKRRGWVRSTSGPTQTGTILWTAAQTREEFYRTTWREMVEVFALGRHPETLALMRRELDDLGQ